jgi:glutaredoxin-like protein NrdH
MDVTHVKGEKKGHVMLYALSTCVWCKRTKKFLNDLGVEYYYIDADLLQGEEKKEIIKEIRQWNPRCSFPTLVIDDKTCIVGYDESKIKEVLQK